MERSAQIFIAGRLHGSGASSESRIGVRFAMLGITVSVAVMMIAICVVIGFKRTITDKVAEATSHIRLVSYEDNSTYELHAIRYSDSLLTALRNLPHVERVEPFYSKPVVLKSEQEVCGAVMMATNDTMVKLSHSMAGKLGVAKGDKLFAYVVGDQLRARRLEIGGLYRTGFEEGDNLFVRVPAALIRQLNGWEEDEASGIQIWIDDRNRLNEVADEVFYATANRLGQDGEALYMETMEQLNPQIFGWLGLLDMNVVIILVLMMAVACFSMVSALIILILDRVQLIATLKALGANNSVVRRIFMLEGLLLVGRGMLMGNVLGLGLMVIQAATHVLPLDAASYYIDYVPVAMPVGMIVMVNILMIMISLLVLMLPTMIARNIQPVEIMRFE